MAAVISPVGGTRIEPTDNYQFVRGTTATFKATFMNNGAPTQVDAMTTPNALILEPLFLNKSGSITPVVVVSMPGSLVAGQQFEYEFTWDIPINQMPLDEYIVSYNGMVGGINFNFGDEYFTVLASAGNIGLKHTSYATVTDIRMMKFNIDDYLPKILASSLTERNNVIEFHLNKATTKLREELSLHRSRTNTENFKLFCIYYTVWSILLASRGEDSSSVSDSNLQYWKGEAMKILDQEKRKSLFQGLPFSRG
jgi:hypothetical protein